MSAVFKTFIKPLVLIAGGCLAVSAYAEKAVQETGSANISSLSNWPVVFLVLIGMVGFIFALAWFVKRFGGLNISGNRDMRIISTIPVGTRERIALLDVNGQQFLIGVTAHQISHLHSFEEAVVNASKTETTFKQSEFFNKLQLVMNPQRKSRQEARKDEVPISDIQSALDQSPTTKRKDDAF